MSGSGAPRHGIHFHHASPILRVQSLAASVAHYINQLGFGMDWEDPGIMVSVSRGQCTLMLCQGDQGHAGTWVWIGVGDVEALFEEYRTRGATIRHPPTNYPWAREMQVQDPDGHVLRFGSDPMPGEPTGPWLDMDGVTWVAAPGGGWTRRPPGAA